MLGSQQWSVTLKEKANVQKYLKLQPSPPHLLVLPHDRMECAPEVMQRAFAAEEPMDCVVSYEDLLLRAKDWPMRTTHRFAQGKGRTAAVAASTLDEDQVFLNKMGQVMAGFMKNQLQEDVSLPGLKIFTKEQKAETKALRGELGDKPESNAKKPKAKVTKKGLKKPASCTKLNAPASKPASKKPAAAMRRPAAAASSSRRNESREERRLRIINAFVPLSLQRQYRNGCAKCYHR
eukprot:s4096_g8.t1